MMKMPLICHYCNELCSANRAVDDPLCSKNVPFFKNNLESNVIIFVPDETELAD